MVQLPRQFTALVGGGSWISAAGAGGDKNGGSELKDFASAADHVGVRPFGLIGALANVSILPIAF